MATLQIRMSLLLTYLVFAVLLNSVGTVILQVIHHYQISKEAASVLEGFKDIPIAVVSFLVASLLPRLGYQRALQLALSLVLLACIAMPLLPAFWTTKLLFLTVGASFALVKVSVYASIATVTRSTAEHASLLNFIEGGFMVGVLSGYWLFAWFMDPSHPNPQQWLQVYWCLALVITLNLVLISITRFPASAVSTEHSAAEDFIAMLRLATKPLVFVFVASAFLYVLIEQGIGSWLPTFNKEVLALPNQLSVQLTSIFAASLALGRLLAGWVLTRLSWYKLLNLCLLCMAVLMLLTLPLTQQLTAQQDVTIWTAPVAAYLLPLVGLFMAPIYPVINSVMLSALPANRHAAMTGLIVVFSALGGTTGSMLTGFTFARFSGQTAFYFCLFPLALLALSVALFHRQAKQPQLTQFAAAAH